jgi:hypothetical protein
MPGYGQEPYGYGTYGIGYIDVPPIVDEFVILPREQLVQRRPAIVSAPGVVLWASHTNLTTCQVALLDEVTPGEAEEAQMAPPSWFFDVVVGPGNNINFGEGEFGVGIFDDVEPDVPDGIYQNHTYDGTDFGEEPFGGLETEWYADTHGPTYWGEGDNGEDGVYP